MENQTLIKNEAAAESSDMRQVILLLEKLNSEQKKQNEHIKKQLMSARLTAIILAVAVAVLICTVIAVVPMVSNLSVKADAVLTDLEKTSAELAKIDFEVIAKDVAEVVENSGELVNSTQKGMSEALAQSQDALQRIQSIDIETLNRSISDLYSAISSLKGLFGFR